MICSAHASWGGEVEKRETDMLGTLIDLCILSEMKTQTNSGAFFPTSVEINDTIIIDDPFLWYCERESASKILIWDKDPHN